MSATGKMKRKSARVETDRRLAVSLADARASCKDINASRRVTRPPLADITNLATALQ